MPLGYAFKTATPKSNHKNCIKNYFGLLKMGRIATSQDLARNWVLVTENCKMPLKNSWVWKAATSVKRKDGERGSRPRVEATEKAEKVASTFGQPNKNHNRLKGNRWGYEKGSWRKTVAGGLFGCGCWAAAATDSANECLLKEQRQVLNQHAVRDQKKNAHETSENQSQELLICIGNSINMGPASDAERNRERERDSRRGRKRYLTRTDSCFSFIWNYLRPRGVMPVGLQNPLRKLIQSVALTRERERALPLFSVCMWMDSLKRIALSFTVLPLRLYLWPGSTNQAK